MPRTSTDPHDLQFAVTLLNLDRIASPIPSDDAPTPADIASWNRNVAHVLTPASTSADITDALRAGMTVHEIAEVMVDNDDDIAMWGAYVMRVRGIMRAMLRVEA